MNGSDFTVEQSILWLQLMAENEAAAYFRRRPSRIVYEHLLAVIAERDEARELLARIARVGGHCGCADILEEATE